MRKERGKNMSRLGKRVRIGKYAIPVLLLLTLAVGTVAAAYYVILTWTTSLTVAANPKVHFIKWQDGSSQNTFSESFTIFPLLKTVMENASHGIKSVTGGTSSIQISSIGTPTNIASIHIKIYNSTVAIYEKTWSSPPTPPSGFESFTTATGKNYAIWLDVTGASGATGSSSIAFELKVGY